MALCFNICGIWTEYSLDRSQALPTRARKILFRTASTENLEGPVNGSRRNRLTNSRYTRFLRLDTTLEWSSPSNSSRAIASFDQ